MDYNFRTLNYLGSKLRLLDFIEQNVLRITKEGAGICDLFAGSGCVSYKLSKHFDVTACDIQSYSSVICSALISPPTISLKHINEFLGKLNQYATLFDCFKPLINLEEGAIANKDLRILSDILENGSIEVFLRQPKCTPISSVIQKVTSNLNIHNDLNTRCIISRYYGGVYFSYRQSVCIDIILEAIHTQIPTNEQNLFIAALLSTASDIVNTVGKHFAQPIKARDSRGDVKSIVYNKAIKDKTIDVFDLYSDWLKKYLLLPRSGNILSTVHGNYIDCLKNLPESVRTVYADPPYTRDHYSRFYHVLETIARGDAPELSTTKIHGKAHISNGIYRSDRHQSPFCIKSQASEAFLEMFENIANTNRNLLLSYSPYDETKKSHPRVVTMHQLITLAKRHFKHVESISAGTFKHNKLNSTGHLLDASDEAELLIVCTNQ